MRRLADIGFFYVAQQVLNLRALILIPLITGTLGLGAYGTLVLAWNAVMLVQVLTALALPSGVVRLLSAQPKPEVVRRELPTLAVFMLLPWSVITAALLLAAQPLGAQLGLPQPVVLVVLVAVRALLEAWYFLFSSYWIATGRNQRYVLLQVGLYAGDLGAVLLALSMQQGVVGVLAASALWEAVFVVALIGALLNETGVGPLDGSALRRYLALCLPAVVSQLMLWILSLSDRFVLAVYRDTQAVGAYNAAYNLANLIMAYNAAIWWLYGARASRQHDLAGPEASQLELRAATRLFLALALPMAAGVSALAAPLLELLLQHPPQQEAVLAVPLVCVGALAYATYIGVSWTFSLRLDTRPLALFSVACGILNVALNLLLVPPLGITGAALSTVVSYVALAALALGFGHRRLAFPVPWGFALRAALATAVMSGLVLAMQPPPHLVGLGAAIAAGAVAYFAALFVLGGITPAERDALRRRIGAAASALRLAGMSRR